MHLWSVVVPAKQLASAKTRLTPLTAAHRQKSVAMAREGIKRLDGFKAQPLNETQKISAAVMRWSLPVI